MDSVLTYLRYKVVRRYLEEEKQVNVITYEISTQANRLVYANTVSNRHLKSASFVG